jgi:uncharacterized repeat protein (TIGR01451 family)
MRGIMKNILAVLAVMGMAVPARAALLANSCITNIATATFSLPSGAAGTGGIKAGVDQFNVPNRFTFTICASDQPTLCMSAWKTTEPPTATIAESGSLVCFTISFSNCGNYSGFGVVITDVMPGNTVKADDGAGPGSKMWAAGGLLPLGGLPWATDLNGPWYVSGEPSAGQNGPLYLRWLFGKVGMHKSGYVRYCVTIL